jgi:hypothetical protein
VKKKRDSWNLEERELQSMSSFEFRECISIMKSTGRRAKTLGELRDLIAIASDESWKIRAETFWSCKSLVA